jgi:hypothetical protein
MVVQNGWVQRADEQSGCHLSLEIICPRAPSRTAKSVSVLRSSGHKGGRGWAWSLDMQEVGSWLRYDMPDEVEATG